MRPVCADCGMKPPETSTNYTLISRTGWRLTRQKGADGSVVAEWHCSKCWARHRATLKQAQTPSGRVPADAGAVPASQPPTGTK